MKLSCQQEVKQDAKDEKATPTVVDSSTVEAETKATEEPAGESKDGNGVSPDVPSPAARALEFTTSQLPAWARSQEDPLKKNNSQANHSSTCQPHVVSCRVTWRRSSRH